MPLYMDMEKKLDIAAMDREHGCQCAFHTPPVILFFAAIDVCACFTLCTLQLYMLASCIASGAEAGNLYEGGR
jgi:hypothetical protein